MVDKMVRHMLSNPVLANAGTPPRVIVDARPISTTKVPSD